MNLPADLHVLLVDCERSDCSHLFETLENWSGVLCCVVHVASAKAAMNILRKIADFDVIIIDVGTEAARRLDTVKVIRGLISRIPILVLASDSDSRLTRSMLDAGAHDCLINGDVHGPLLRRAIFSAIEWSRWQAELHDLENIIRPIMKVLSADDTDKSV